MGKMTMNQMSVIKTILEEMTLDPKMELPVDKMLVDEMANDKIVCMILFEDKILVDKLPFGEITVDKMSIV